MRWKGLSLRTKTTLCQQLPADFQVKLTEFRKFTNGIILEHAIGGDNIVNMGEVPMTFDIPLTKTVNKKGESSVSIGFCLFMKSHEISRNPTKSHEIPKNYEAKLWNPLKFGSKIW